MISVDELSRRIWRSRKGASAGRRRWRRSELGNVPESLFEGRWRRWQSDSTIAPRLMYQPQPWP